MSKASGPTGSIYSNHVKLGVVGGVLEDIVFRYVFKFEKDETTRKYQVKLDPETFGLIPQLSDSEKDEFYPIWTDLEFHKCQNCPLNTKTHRQCPVAKNIYHLVEHFKHDASIRPSQVFVEGPERMYMKKTSLQEGLSSILGLLMATSDCPHFYFLRPMARYHMPFSTDPETTLRSVSFYLLGQYFMKKSGRKIEFSLDNLNKAYTALGVVNMGLASRIRNVAKGDADKNAISILSTLGMIIASNISTNLEDLASQVRPFFEQLEDQSL